MARPKMDTERKAQILSAFESCVVRDGLARTTLVNVAKEVGLPRSLVRYFVGNREDMVGLLIERMIERAEDDLADMLGDEAVLSLNSVLDFLFFRAFDNELSNTIVVELWYLAQRDPDIKARLARMYSVLREKLTHQMKDENVGKDHAHRQTLAQALMSLAYGQASFADLGLAPRNKQSSRQLAHAILAGAQ